MTPAQVAHILALVDQYAATRNAGYIGSFGTPAEARAAVEAALRDAPQADGWRDHVEQRIRTWRQSTMNKSGDRLAIDDFMEQDSIDDLVDFVCDEYAFPSAPTAVEPVQRDTERMNWLEQVGTATIQRMRRLDPKAPKYWDIEFGNDENTASGQSLRAAIDAARASKGTP